MLFDPEKPVRRDEDTRVYVSNTSEAERQCREIVDILQKRGKAVNHLGVKKSKSGKSHNCIQEWEVDDDE